MALLLRPRTGPLHPGRPPGRLEYKTQHLPRPPVRPLGAPRRRGQHRISHRISRRRLRRPHRGECGRTPKPHRRVPCRGWRDPSAPHRRGRPASARPSQPAHSRPVHDGRSRSRPAYAGQPAVCRIHQPCRRLRQLLRLGRPVPRALRALQPDRGPTPTAQLVLPARQCGAQAAAGRDAAARVWVCRGRVRVEGKRQGRGSHRALEGCGERLGRMSVEWGV
mmetsp:Transcript_4135/g.12808  ORF Transcript_4135/g.12808 Transcript_4135/m.12808 type:complete len:221 (-) Transcript_4135:151-813(-)